MPQLIFYLEKDYPQVHDLKTDKVSIGRNKDNDIIVKDACVSVYHAELRKEKDGFYHVKDLGSHNGTVVNGMPVDESVLKDGDKLKFGVIKVVFLDRGAVGAKGGDTKLAVATADVQKELDAKSSQLAKLEEAIKAKSGLISSLEANRSKIENLEKASTDLKLKHDKGNSALQNLQIDLRSAEDKKAELLKGISQQENKLTGLRREHDQLKAAAESSKKQKEQFEADLGTIRKELEESKTKLAENKQLSEKVEAVASEIDEKKSSLEILTKQVADREAERHRISQEIDQANADLDKSKSELKEIVAELATKSDELDKSNAELQKVRAELDVKKQEVADAAAVVEEAKATEAKIEELKSDLAARQADAEELSKQIAESELTATDLGKQIEESSQSLEKVTAALSAKQKSADQLEARVKENNEIIEGFEEKVATMEVALKTGVADLAKSQDTQKALINDSQSLTQLISEKSGVLEHLKEKIYAKQYETEIATVCPPLRVIKPDMRSLVHYFHHAAGVPDQDKIDPVGFYGLAACTKGSVHREADTIPQSEEPVLILLQGNWEQDSVTVANLAAHMAGRILLVCWPEGQLEALFEGQEKAAFVDYLKSFLSGISGIISTDGRTAKLLDDFDLGLPHLSVPLPCPVDSPDWNLPDQNTDRSRGIFLSSNGFDPESDLHRSRLELLGKIASKAQTTVTIYPEIPDLSELVDIPEASVSVFNEPMRYSQYLATIRDHYLVMGMGSNEFGGNVVGDAILTKTIYIGGDKSRAIEELLFSDFCISASDAEGPLNEMILLLNDQNSYFEAIEQSQKMAMYLFSFETVSDRINEFIHFISSGN